MFAITRLIASLRLSLYSLLRSARSSKFSPGSRDYQVKYLSLSERHAPFLGAALANTFITYYALIPRTIQVICDKYSQETGVGWRGESTIRWRSEARCCQTDAFARAFFPSPRLGPDVHHLCALLGSLASLMCLCARATWPLLSCAMMFINAQSIHGRPSTFRCRRPTC